jgi:hypothetical protein
MVLLRTSEKSGSCFIRTDQLDGETDWKLRVAVSAFQHLPSDMVRFSFSCYVFVVSQMSDTYFVVVVSVMRCCCINDICDVCVFRIFFGYGASCMPRSHRKIFIISLEHFAGYDMMLVQ